MLKLRKEQMDAFSLASLKQFEVVMHEHAQQYFPNHYRMAGRDAIQAMIEHGYRQAKDYLSDTQHDVAIYFTSMLILGTNFDQDFLYPWCQEILQGEAESRDRAEQLMQSAVDFQKRVAGPRNRDLHRAYLKLHREGLTVMRAPEVDDLESYKMELLGQLYPRRFDVLGEETVRQLHESSRQIAEKYELTSPRGEVLIAIVSFLIGSMPDQEFLVPWFSEVLSQPPSTDRVQLLADEIARVVAAWLKQQW